MAYKDIQRLIYQEMKKENYSFNVSYYQLDSYHLWKLKDFAKMSGFRYNDKATGKSYDRAFYDSMVRYHDKIKKGVR